MVQTDKAITKTITTANDNSGTVGVGASVADGVKLTVGVVVRVGEELDELTGVEDEFVEAKFANVLNASFEFPLPSKRPKLRHRP